MATAQSIQLNQGCLFLVDNAKRCPPGIAMRAFTTEMIEEHLKRHTYYYQRGGRQGLEHKSVVTATYMRKNPMKRLTERPEPPDDPLAYQRQPMEISTDAIFRLGSDGIATKVWRLFRYDRATFKESQLPDYEEIDGEEGNQKDEAASGHEENEKLSREHDDQILNDEDYVDHEQYSNHEADSDYEENSNHEGNSGAKIRSLTQGYTKKQEVSQVHEDDRSSGNAKFPVEVSTKAPLTTVGRPCTQCRISRTRCDRASPCESCITRGRGGECTPQEPVSSTGATATSRQRPHGSQRRPK